MAKYSFELKMKVVKEYLEGKGGYKYLCNLNGIKSHSNIEKWVHNYNVLGEEGLTRTRKNKIYSFEFKQNVVELYLRTELSYNELAVNVGINNPALIANWVSNYRVAGPAALKPRKKGRHPKMNKPDLIKDKRSSEENEKDNYLEQLENENLSLRIENAYLKELRRLRLEAEASTKEKRESSAVSEDHFD
jgi:transposase